MNCKYDITIKQRQILGFLISAQLAQHVYPETIVSTISTFLKITEPISIENTNVCLYYCLSSCIYDNTTFTKNDFIYDIPETIACLISCHPQKPPIPVVPVVAPTDLQQEVAALTQQKEAQLVGIAGQLDSTLGFLDGKLADIMAVLAITIAGFSAFIAQRLVHEGIATIAAAGKVVGEAIEVLVTPLKTASEIDILGSKAAIIASISDPAPGPLVHTHPLTVNNAANVLHADATIGGEIGENVSGMGSDVESVSDIVGSGGDILFDSVRLGFDFASLGAQIAQTQIAIDATNKQMEEAKGAAEAATLAVTADYDKAIAARETMIEYKTEFDSAEDPITSAVQETKVA